MITYIDNSNTELVAKYTQLFDDAELALGGDVSIEDLPSYFSYLDNLANLSNGAKFVRLPLDEDVFVIDADKRSITVPKAFSSSGISVKDDEIAEIVYFKINRFFDIADLSKKKIVIEWENAAGVKGLTADFERDTIVENGEDFLVFGWPLDSRITSAAGTIKFAVRFYTLNSDNEIDYSLSTMAASAKILSTLEVPLVEANIEDLKSKVLARLIPADSPLKVPTIATNLPTDGELVDGSLALSVVAGTTPSGNTLSYQWFKDGAKWSGIGNVASATATELGEYYVVLTNTITVIDSYDADGNALATHTESSSLKSNVCKIPAPDSIVIDTDLAASALFASEGDDAGKAIVSMKINKPNGTLVAKAQRKNKSGDAYADASAALASVASVVDPDDATKMIVTMTVVEEQATGYENFRIALANTRNGQTTQTVVSAICRITAAAVAPTITMTYGGEAISGSDDNGYYVDLDTTKSLKANIASGLASDSLAYQWYAATVASGDDETIKNATAAEYKPTAAGEFYCIVKNTLNGSVASATSKHITVVKRA